jgi:iron complex transport system substrate-binding protein
MAARSSRLIPVLIVAFVFGGAGTGASQSTTRAAQTSSLRETSRIVSLVPALTEMLFAIGAGPHVVGVSNFDTFPPEVRALPRVGALLDPDTERILALRPTLVIVYGSQKDAAARFERAGIRTFSYRHGGISTILATIRELGTVTGNAAEAARVATDLRGRIDAIHERVRGRPQPRTLLVIDREKGTLRSLYAAGGNTFLNEMLEAAGGRNVFADVKSESVQPSHETLLARAPDVILEVRAAGMGAKEGPDAQKAWASLASIPAVRNGRITVLLGEHLVVPGPRLAQGVEALARALHPEVFR